MQAALRRHLFFMCSNRIFLSRSAGSAFAISMEDSFFRPEKNLTDVLPKGVFIVRQNVRARRYVGTIAALFSPAARRGRRNWRPLTRPGGSRREMRHAGSRAGDASILPPECVGSTPRHCASCKLRLARCFVSRRKPNLRMRQIIEIRHATSNGLNCKKVGF